MFVCLRVCANMRVYVVCVCMWCVGGVCVCMYVCMCVGGVCVCVCVPPTEIRTSDWFKILLL